MRFQAEVGQLEKDVGNDDQNLLRSCVAGDHQQRANGTAVILMVALVFQFSVMA